MATEVESVVMDVLEVVEDVSQNTGSNDFVEVDRITFALSRSSNRLGSVITVVLTEGTFHPDIVSWLRELHLCLTQLWVEWETRLQRFHNQLPCERPSLGRPAMTLNIPMVSFMFPLMLLM